MHGFLHKFLGTVRRQWSLEGWVKEPAQPPQGCEGKVTMPGCRRLCGAVLVNSTQGSQSERYP